MIHFFYGTDAILKRRAKDALYADILKKNPDANRLQFSDVDFSPDAIIPLISEASLFGTISIIELYNIFDAEEPEQFVLQNLKALAESQNIFLFVENALTKDVAARIEKAGANMERFDAKAVFKKEWNAFALTDAFAARDKKNAWILFTKAIERGSSPEEIIGTLFWQVKTLFLVKSAKNPNAEALGISPFVFKKALSASARFTEKEITSFLSRLTGIYHDSHRGVVDGEVALEQFLLEALA